MKKTDGYTTDVNYPAFFYKEMQPVWLSCVTRFLGFSAPDVVRPFRLCELGCGVGINLLVAAASHSNAEFVGVDFNASHVGMAQEAAQAAGLKNITFIHSDFAQFAAHHAQPFDFITTHGVWSWIAPQHQNALLACVNAKLQSGGIFYLHYMCHPGSTDLLTVQHFLHLFAPHVPGTSAQQAQMGLKLLCQLGERGLFNDRPGVLKHLHNLRAKDPHDLAHEFLTDHWQPQHSVAVHQRISETGLNYLGSADVFNNLDISLSIPGNMQSVIQQTKIPAVAETLKDLARNSHQRMDIFQRQPQVLVQDTYVAQLNAMVFQLLPAAPAAGPIAFATPIGQIDGPETLCTALLQRLAAGPTSFAELAQLPALAGQESLLLQTLQLMMLQEIVHPRHPEGTAQSKPVQGLVKWLESQRMALQLVGECGTAVRQTGAHHAR